ncbi:IclR family transcriptional regulator [Megasphaera hominis]|jgi:IclR family KDG regulon transcriptional repressor|uniref:IclR family transcriptional regulator n=1 Tax=Megasphaera hominis TaxID=159836 RepID=A0ABR6VKC9_9FIRM|nr:IclR family transcriptional regulator [Megasphaera hominis]MBC3537159.1 IclR family transcriptional regulator [Megasphaera hominis]
MPTEKPASFQAIDRACLVLETIADQGQMSLNDLHTRLKLNKASLSRIVLSLTENGFLNRDEKSGEYSLSLKLFEIGVKATKATNYPRLITSELEKLASSLQVVAQFSVEDNGELLCLQSIDPENMNSFSVYTSVGGRSPLYATSAGKAILSTYTNEEIMEKWNTFHVKTITPHTLTTLDALLQDIAETRKRKYAVDHEETEPNLFCIGAVIMNYTNRPIGAISLSAHSLTAEEEKHYSEELLKSVQLLSASMGYTGPVR